jgi:putative ABC transport system permease protein
MAIPEISATSIASSFPFGTMMIGSYMSEGVEREQVFINYMIDHNYIDFLKLKIIEGDAFSKDGPIHENEVIINETLAKRMNWDNPIGKTFKSEDDKTQEYRVIGLVKDFHVKSFKAEIYPIYLKYNEQPKFYRSIGVKYQANDVQVLMNRIENVCKSVNASQEYSIEFMSQIVENKYLEDYRTGKMFTNFAILAIIIASLGLYGLALFISRQKTKEIGVRKVFGGSIYEIVFILSKNFLKLIVISAIIAVPVAWFYTDKWLQSFVYQVENRGIVFVLATILAILIAFLTIFYQSYKAASSNPIDAIKYE